MAAGGVRLDLQVGLDLAYLRSQLSGLSTLAQKYSLPIKAELDTTQLQKQLRAASKEVRLNINDTSVISAIKNTENLIKQLNRLSKAASSATATTGTAAGVAASAGPSRTFRQVISDLDIGQLRSIAKAAAQDGIIKPFEESVLKDKGKLLTALNKAANNAGQGFLNGLENQQSALAKAAGNYGNALIAGIKKTLKMASPSKKMEELGDDAGKGFEKGLENGLEAATRLGVNEIRELYRALKNEAKAGSQALAAIIQGSMAGIVQLPGGRQQRQRLQTTGGVINQVMGGTRIPNIVARQSTIRGQAANASAVTPSFLSALPLMLGMNRTELGARIGGIYGQQYRAPAMGGINQRRIEKLFGLLGSGGGALGTGGGTTVSTMGARSAFLPGRGAPGLYSAALPPSLVNYPIGMPAAYGAGFAGTPRGGFSMGGNAGIGRGLGFQFPESGMATKGVLGFATKPFKNASASFLNAIKEDYRDIQFTVQDDINKAKNFISNLRARMTGSTRTPSGGGIGIGGGSFVPTSGIFGGGGGIGAGTGSFIPFGGGGGGGNPPMPPGGGGGGNPPNRPPSGVIGGGSFGGGLPQNISFPSLPGKGAVRELADEFKFATQQILLFGQAYKLLGFIQDLPTQVGSAVGKLQSFNNTIKQITPSAQEASASSEFILNVVERYNVPLDSARDGFTKLYASMAPTGFNGDEIRNLFLGISKAAATFGLSADKVDRVTYAFAQMASKGQVMSEELKGQLGDVLPGSMAIFAEAAGFKGTDAIQKFSKALEDGAYKANAARQLISNVGVALNREFGAGAEGAAKTYQGVINRIQNSTKLFYESLEPLAVGFANSVIVPVSQGLRNLAEGIKSFTTGQKAASEGGQAVAASLREMAPVISGLISNIKLIAGNLVQLVQGFGGIVKIITTILSLPLVGYIASTYAQVMLLYGAFVLLNGQALIPLIRNIGLFLATLPGVARYQLAMLGLAGATQQSTMAMNQFGAMVQGVMIKTVIGIALVAIGALVARIVELRGQMAAISGSAKQMGEAVRISAKFGDIGGTKEALSNLEDRVNTYKELEKRLQAVNKKRNETTSFFAEIDSALGQQLMSLGVLSGSSLTKTANGYKVSFGNVSTAIKIATKNIEEFQAEFKKQQSQLPVAEKNKAKQKTITEQPITGVSKDDQKKTNLEGYYSLQDQLAKDFTQAEIDRLEKLHQAAMDRLNAEYNLKEARANSFQKEALKFERKLMEIDMKRQKALLDASNEVVKAREGVVQNAAGIGAGGAYLQGNIGPTSTGPHFDVKRVGGGYFPRNYLDKYVMVNGKPLSSGTTVPGGTFAGHQRRGSHGWDYAFGSGRHAATLTGGAEWMEGVSTAHGEQRRFKLPTGEIFQFLHGRGEGIGAGGARKVGANERRDTVAQQKEQLALAKQSLVVQLAEAQAIRETQVAMAEYMASIAPIEEQELQNSLLAKKNELIRSGMTDAIIEKEMKYFEASEKTRLGIDVIQKLLDKKKISAEDAAKEIADLNDRLAKYGKLLNQGVIQEGIGKFEQSMDGLKKKAEQLQAPLGMERLVELRQSGLTEEQAMQQFKAEEAIAKMQRLRDAVKGVADGINSSLGTALVDSILKFDSLNEVAANFLNSVAGYFRDLANSIIQEMTRAFVNKAVQSLLNGIVSSIGGIAGGAIPGLGGGFSTGSAFSMAPGLIPGASGIGMPSFTGGIGGGIIGFATGGVVTGPTLGLVGEGRYNEAVVPLPDGRSIPVELSGGGDGGNVNVVVNVDAKGSSVQGNEPNANQLGQVISVAVQSEIIRQQRPGGLLASSRR